MQRRGIALGVEGLLRRLHVGSDRRKAVGELFGRRRAGERRQAGDSGIDAVEQRLLLALGRHGRLDEPIGGRATAAAGQREQLPRPLAFVHAARFGADLRVRFAEQRIVDGCADARDGP